MKRHAACGDLFWSHFSCRRRLPSAAELKPFERGSWQQLLRAHAGRPTLVHFWGVTCGPCKVELPLLGQFMKDHPARRRRDDQCRSRSDLPGATRSMLERRDFVSRELDF